jgi:hypothetical protein
VTELEPYNPQLLQPATDSWVAVVSDVSKLAGVIADTDMVPKALRRNVPAVTAAILYGREIGLAPMTALRSVYVVNGSVALRAETMRALILAAGHDFEFVETTSALATVRGRRRGSDTWRELTYTIDDARAAGLAQGDNWRKHPRRMLKARATGDLATEKFPDVIGGFQVLEEVDDTAQPPGPEPAAATRKVTRHKTASPAASHAARAGEAPQSPSEAPQGAQDAPEPPARTMAPTQPPEPPQKPPASAPTPPEQQTPGLIPLPGEPGYDTLGLAEPETAPAADSTPTAGATPKRDTSGYQPTQAQIIKIHTIYGQLGVTDPDIGRALTGIAAGRDGPTSTLELNRGEAVQLIDTLELIQASEFLRETITNILEAEDPQAALAELAEQMRPEPGPPTVTDVPDPGGRLS